MTEKCKQASDELPRRNDLGRMNATELRIVDAMYSVEAMPADQRLTQASTLLQQAKDLVSDYVDAAETYYRPDEPLSPEDQAAIDAAWTKHKSSHRQHR